MTTSSEPSCPGERRTTCGRRGISLQPVRAHKVADKAEAERAHAAVRTQFGLHLPGYLGHRPGPTGSAGEGAPG